MTEEELKRIREADDALIPNVGDFRKVVQKGTVKTGNAVKEIDITFKRVRNQQGGVDVVAELPSFGITGKSGI